MNIHKISKIATVIIFLALIRTLIEPFRLQYYSSSSLSLADIKPFLVGSLVSALGLLLMTILSYYDKHKFIIGICILTIVGLIIIKQIYFIK